MFCGERAHNQTAMPVVMGRWDEVKRGQESPLVEGRARSLFWWGLGVSLENYFYGAWRCDYSHNDFLALDVAHSNGFIDVAILKGLSTGFE